MLQQPPPFGSPHCPPASLGTPDPANICRAADFHGSMSNFCPLRFPEEVINQQAQ